MVYFLDDTSLPESALTAFRCEIHFVLAEFSGHCELGGSELRLHWALVPDATVDAVAVHAMGNESAAMTAGIDGFLRAPV